MRSKEEIVWQVERVHEEEITKFVSKKDREKERYLYIDREREREIFIYRERERCIAEVWGYQRKDGGRNIFQL